MKTTKLLTLILLVFSGMLSKAQSVSNVQAYPNPFVKDVNIHFDLNQDDTVTLKVFNLIGKNVGVLYSGEALKKDAYNVIFNGDSLSNGVYFLKFENGDSSISKKLIKDTVMTTEVFQINLENKQLNIIADSQTGMVKITLEGKKQVTVSDLSGRVIKKVVFEGEELDLSALRQGSYIISVYLVDDHKISTQKMIKL